MKIFIGIFIGLMAITRIEAQPLTFYRESLNFEIDSSHFYVSGMYFLRNPNTKPGTTRILYPYVYETSQIETISVVNLLTMKKLDVLPVKKGHSFQLQVPGNDSVVLHIKYSHQHDGTRATYILTTTKFWHRPFDEADYTLRVKKGIVVEKLFLPPDTTWIDLDYIYYHWKRRNFMPESDFTIEFRPH
ncbi:MAG TPA: hypothetical protein DCQ26_18940 [Marinilabiliales bacterium]|jgi:hypothetical protein|nr:MAG: hypothetical protein A2W95_12250 [Bacteroidetes bacterium GWA2_40_14]OFX61346.1 MAG: hypothetical protein A2W84_11060 [Bacteroidetes bacterium GWC2_40_13]OFX73473.1 MAG: hypothetical protein A2W96_10995 [Bacteroidetes bacterium GWD2_40_43]OFX90627.1 MAG: hypothetical protein A2W97_02535 [Bacteroidetes bacterium GWE2_40_63]OFY20896.1 MAG: hypothetical protein A2W88_17730 [Bacteroidetes bacterium GWF2_40_13]OFZ23685.1 MAG: hypothetical protein A2437_06510 [Bacteroidetes bacterium RIFOXYC